MDERYIAAVDLGTSKIAVTVAQISSKGVQMLYYRESPSEGIRNSYVFNPQKAADKVREALADAEDELKIKIHQVVTGLPRYEVSQVNARAEFERSDSESSITREEIDFLKNNAIDTYPLPDPDKTRARKRTILEGDVPSPLHPPAGCRFHTRCPYATEECAKSAPEWKEHSPGHFASCHKL